MPADTVNMNPGNAPAQGGVAIDAVSFGAGTAKVDRQVVAIGDSTTQGNYAGVSSLGELSVKAVDVTAAAAALGALNATVQVAMNGLAAASVLIAGGGTLVGTLVPEWSPDGGTTWAATLFYTPATGAISASTAVASGQAALPLVIVSPGGASHVRVRVSAYTSGTVNASLRAAANVPLFVPSPTTPGYQRLQDGTTTALLVVNADGSIGIRNRLNAGSDGQVAAGADLVAQGLSNGTTVDVARGNSTLTLLASAARTATIATPTQTNFNARGVMVFVNVTAVGGTTPTLTGQFFAVDPLSAASGSISAVSTAISAVGPYTFFLYPTAMTQGFFATNGALPRLWFFNLALGGTTPSFTFSVTASYIL